jgi:xanthine/uracil/vitamin C permease (AzgA family)
LCQGNSTLTSWECEVLNPCTHCLPQGTPFAIKLATVVGMGLLIALIGMVSIKIVVSNPQVWMASPVDPYT